MRVQSAVHVLLAFVLMIPLLSSRGSTAWAETNETVNPIRVAGLSSVQAADIWSRFGKLGTIDGTALGEFLNPAGVAVDSGGNVYMVDTGNNRIQKLTVSTNEWSEWGSSGSGLGEFSSPRGIAVDSSGNVYVADVGNYRIQKLTPGANGAPDSWSEWKRNGGGSGSGLGEFSAPSGVAVDSSGNVYVADVGNHRIQKLTPGANGAPDSWSEWKKSGGGSGSGLGEFNAPYGIAVDGGGNVYVADTGNHRIQKLTPGVNGAQDSWSEWKKSGGGSGNGLGQFYSPEGVAVDSSGNVYVVDTSNHRIQKLTLGTNGIQDSWNEWKKSDGGIGTGLGEFFNPAGVAVDSNGNMYVADANNHRIQKYAAVTNSWSQFGKLTPVTGTALGEFNSPEGVAVDNSGNVYIADTNNHRIQKLTVSTNEWSEWKKSGGGSGSGAGEFSSPRGIAVDSGGNVYVADTSNHRIQKLALGTNGAPDSWSEWKKSGGGSGSGLGEFSSPRGVAVDNSGNVYVVDTGNHRIQKLNVGANGTPDSWSEWKKDGGGSGSGAGEFSSPRGIAVDSGGNVYVADTSNHRIQKLTPGTNGVSESWSEWGKSGGGSGSSAGEFSNPSGVAVDSSGNVYVADTSNQRIQMLTASTSIWSEWKKSSGGSGKGLGEFSSPRGVAVDNSANMYVADTSNHRIQKKGGVLTNAAEPVITTQPTGATVNVDGSAQLSVAATVNDGGVLSYQWYSNTANSNSGGSAVTGATYAAYNPPTNASGTVYYYAVVTNTNNSVNGTKTATVTSNAVEVTVNALTAPGIPQNFTAAGGNRQVTLNWSAVTEATYYSIYMSTTPGQFAGTPVATVTSNTYNILNLTNGTAYSFVVRAGNSGGLSAASNEAGAIPATVPDAPANVAATAGIGAATVTFTAPTDNGGNAITGYIVTASPGNLTMTGTASPIVITGLTNGTSYTFTVKAVNAIGSSEPSADSNAVVPIRLFGSGSGGNGSGAAPSTESSAGGVDVLVNGKAENAGTEATSSRNGQTVTTVSIDQKKLDDKLAMEGLHTVVTIPVQAKSDIIVGELNGQMIKNMENKQAILEMKTDRATYTLPAEQINIDSISSWLGKSVALQDIRVQIEIAAPAESMMKLAENAATTGAFTLVAPPVEFAIRGIYEDTIIEISKFNAYVERMIALPSGIDSNKITTGVVIDPDGTVRHVPSRVVAIDGYYYAKINSLTNSMYSVIWHPLEFADVASHWSKHAVNEAGSRMIVNGVDNDRFCPDLNMTRAEFAAVIVRGLGLKLEKGATPFADVNLSDWYSSAINTATAYRLSAGFEDGTFRPNESITREQAMVMIAKAMQITGLKGKLPSQAAEVALKPYTDAADISDWARSGIADSVQAGIVSGRSNTELVPQAFITRAEVAAIILMLLEKSDLI
ncbi:S-layer homology domain-containing protein [Paenibacillus thalictri]|nr:S-layer homology domain-containing protein [Paenibacillus thalictri]